MFWVHFTDPLHSVRTARNAFGGRNLMLHTRPGTFFNAVKILELKRQFPSILTDKILPPEVIAPADKMNMKLALKLLNKAVAQSLANIAVVAQDQQTKQTVLAIREFIL